MLDIIFKDYLKSIDDEIEYFKKVIKILKGDDDEI